MGVETGGVREASKTHAHTEGVCARHEKMGSRRDRRGGSGGEDTRMWRRRYDFKDKGDRDFCEHVLEEDSFLIFADKRQRSGEEDGEG